MAVFVICRVGRPDLMRGLLEQEFPGNHHYLAHGQWLVSTTGTARELSDRLDKASPEASHGSAMILRVSSYWGRAATDTWEWMHDRMQASNGS